MLTLIESARRVQRLAAVRLHRTLGGGRERGDVPGWVLITLMTAGLVTVIWLLAGEQLTKLFSEALNNVSGPGSK